MTEAEVTFSELQNMRMSSAALEGRGGDDDDEEEAEVEAAVAEDEAEVKEEVKALVADLPLGLEGDGELTEEQKALNKKV